MGHLEGTPGSNSSSASCCNTTGSGSSHTISPAAESRGKGVKQRFLYPVAGENKEKEGEEERERERATGITRLVEGAGVKVEEGEEKVVEEVGDEANEEGGGTCWSPNPSPKITLPHWLLKALGPSSAPARKAVVSP